MVVRSFNGGDPLLHGRTHPQRDLALHHFNRELDVVRRKGRAVVPVSLGPGLDGQLREFVVVFVAFRQPVDKLAGGPVDVEEMFLGRLPDAGGRGIRGKQVVALPDIPIAADFIDNDGLVARRGNVLAGYALVGRLCSARIGRRGNRATGQRRQRQHQQQWQQSQLHGFTPDKRGNDITMGANQAWLHAPRSRKADLATELKFRTVQVSTDPHTAQTQPPFREAAAASQPEPRAPLAWRNQEGPG